MSETRTRRKSRGKRRTPAPQGFSLLLLKNGGLGVCGGMTSILLLLLGGSALCYASPNPHALLLPVALGVLYLSAVITGWLTRQLHGISPILCGLVGGGGLWLLTALLSLFLPKEGEAASLFSLALRLLILPAACLGAILCEKKSRPRHRRSGRR